MRQLAVASAAVLLVFAVGAVLGSYLARPLKGRKAESVADSVRSGEAPPKDVQGLVDKLHTQKGITIHHDEIKGANHFFEHELDQLMKSVDNYLDMRLDPNSPIR